MAFRSTLRAGYAEVAFRIQESLDTLTSGDVRERLSDAVRAATKDSGYWSYYLDHTGDDAAGEVYYSCGGDTMCSPYTVTKTADAAATATVDHAAGKKVVPRLVYDPAQPKTTPVTESLRLVEHMPGSGFLETLKLREGARSTYPVLLISPGTGSSAHYSRETLKKAADDGVFKARTFMYWNHPTLAEEAARPEGDLDKLAAITTKPGYWDENGPKGPAVYAEAKPMADYADKIEARAGDIGLSIRAGGTTSGKVVNGKPDLASIDYVESVDYVTRAGRGGMALAESAQFTKLLESFNEGEVSDMDAAEIKKLQESLATQTANLATQTAINERLVKRALRADALELAAAVLATTSLTEAQRKFVAESVVGTSDAPREAPVKDGALDAPKLTEAVNAQAKAYSASLPPTGGPRGVGAGPTLVAESAEVKAARTEALKETQNEQVRSLMALGLSEAAAKESVGVAA